MSYVRDEKRIAQAQKAWHDQDLETFRKTDEASMARRKDAFLELLTAHIPVLEQGKED